MRRALRTAAALAPLLALPLATNAEAGRALELCRQAFDPAAHAAAGTSGAGEFARKLRLLREGAALGHLPSQYHLAVYFSGESTSTLAGVPDRAERDAILTRLADATFPLAERAVAWRSKDEGFSGNRWAKGFDEHAAAVKRWRFFTWMTRAALHGDRMAWEALAEFYPYEIERYSGDADARVRGYVWAYLRSIPVDDVDRSALGSVWAHKEREAWARLEGPEEQERARATAARYEREVFPKLIRDTSALAICSLEPQFARDVTAARRIPSPVGPPPNPPDPSTPAYKRVHLPPVPTAPDGVTVVSGSFETERSVEIGKYVPVAAVPAGRTGVIERAIVVVRDAPIFAERGRLSLQLYLERPGSKRQPLVGAEPRIPAVVDSQIAEQGILVSGGETITFWCRSTTIDRKAAFDKGCTVEVYVWIHDGAGHAGGQPASDSRLPFGSRAHDSHWRGRPPAIELRQARWHLGQSAPAQPVERSRLVAGRTRLEPATRAVTYWEYEGPES